MITTKVSAFNTHPSNLNEWFELLDDENALFGCISSIVEKLEEGVKKVLEQEGIDISIGFERNRSDQNTPQNDDLNLFYGRIVTKKRILE